MAQVVLELIDEIINAAGVISQENEFVDFMRVKRRSDVLVVKFEPLKRVFPELAEWSYQEAFERVFKPGQAGFGVFRSGFHLSLAIMASNEGAPRCLPDRLAMAMALRNGFSVGCVWLGAGCCGCSLFSLRVSACVGAGNGGLFPLKRCDGCQTRFSVGV